MTHEELENYITRLLPNLRKKHVYTANDDEDCQLSLLDLLRKVDQHIFTNDKEFTSLFLSYYNCRRVQRRRRYGVLYQDRPVIGLDGWDIIDPWNTAQIQALEYLELIRDKYVKQLMFQRYILGYTIEELMTEHSISRPTVHRYIKRGIDRIKLGLSS